MNARVGPAGLPAIEIRLGLGQRLEAQSAQWCLLRVAHAGFDLAFAIGIAATNRDLQQDVASGRFRRDLFYRLSVFPIILPPLRERADDIPSLATHFLEQAAQRYGRRGLRLTERAMRTLEGYTWPGNVRELQHVIERAVLLSRNGVVRLDAVLAEPAETTHVKSAPSTTIATVIPEIQWRRREQENLGAALRRAEGRIYGPDGAADILGVKPTTLISRLKALGLRDPRKRPRRQQNRP